MIALVSFFAIVYNKTVLWGTVFTQIVSNVCERERREGLWRTSSNTYKKKKTTNSDGF